MIISGGGNDKYVLFNVNLRSATEGSYPSSTNDYRYFVININKLQCLNFTDLSLRATYGSIYCTSTFTINSITFSNNLLSINMTLTSKGNGEWPTSQVTENVSLTAQIYGDEVTLVTSQASAVSTFSKTLSYTSRIYLDKPLIIA